MTARKIFWLIACVLSALVFALLVGPRATQAQGVEHKWQTPPSTAPIVDLLVAPSYGHGETIYILTETDLYRSTDAGASWSQLAAWPEEMEELGEATFRAGAIVETSFPDSSAMVAEESGAYEQGHMLWIADSSGGVWTVDAAAASWMPLAPTTPTTTGAPSNGLQPAFSGPLPPSANLSAAELTISAQQEIVADGILRFMGLSPDGERLLVAQNFSDLCFRNTVTLQELGCAHVSESIKRVDHERITWSPDQHTLALTEDSPYAFQESDIWILDIDTGESTNLTDDGVIGSITVGDEVDYMPLWSLDAQEIYFVRTITGDDPSTNLYAIPADGGDLRKILALADSSFALHGTMHWSQDGSGLYFSRFLPQLNDPTNGMWRYDILTHSLRQLLGPDEERGIPTVRAVNTVTGKALIQYLERPDRYATLSPTTYALLDLATEELSVLLPAVEQDELLPSVTGATLSPDGSKVLFSYSDSQENFHVIVRDVDGGEDNVLMSNTEALGASATRGKELTWANNDTVMIVAGNEGRLVKLAAE
jgi:hypothetical protein